MKAVIVILSVALLTSLTSCGSKDRIITYRDTETGQVYKKESYWFVNNGKALRVGYSVDIYNNPKHTLVVVGIE